jgi:hypothetical protein
MSTEKIVSERRNEARKKVKIIFLFKMGLFFSGRGIAKDINQKGICLVCPKLFKPRPSVQLKDYIGATLQVMIPSEIMTISGIIAWVDLKKGEGGIRISSTSNDEAWSRLCK